MPPVERAAITGSGGIDTVLGAAPAGNAAQKRNITAALTDDEREKLIDLVDRLIRNPDAVTAKDCIIGNDVRTVQWIAEHTRALLTSPRPGLPCHVLASLECTAVWLEKGKDPQDAARELRACLAKIDAPVAETFARLPLSAEQRSALVWAIGRTRAQDELALADVLLDILNLSPVEVHPIGSVRVDLIRSANVSEVSEPVLTLSSDFEAAIDMSPGTEFNLYASPIEFHESRAVASPATASGLPAWFDTFLTNVCEIPDRNSPVGEPDAIIATLDELKNCALNAIEKCVPAPATADEYAAFAWPPLPAFPESFAHVAGHAYFTEHQMQGYANAYGEAIRTAQAATPHSARVAALEAENRELAEFVVAVGGFWGESRSKLIGPLSLAEVIKQAMREQVFAPADHCLRAPTICAGSAAAPAEAREPVATFDDGLKAYLDSWTGGRHEAGSFGEVTLRFTDERYTSFREYRAKDLASADVCATFQARVQPWMLECFGPTIAADRVERNHRFLEEALETVQSLGCTASEAHQLVDYTFGRPVGEPAQEVGGVMVTLAALCLANTLDMHAAGETELARISEPATVLKIRAKQAAKPKHSPLPQAVAARAPYEWRDTGPLETNEGGAA